MSLSSDSSLAILACVILCILFVQYAKTADVSSPSNETKSIEPNECRTLRSDYHSLCVRRPNVLQSRDREFCSAYKRLCTTRVEDQSQMLWPAIIGRDSANNSPPEIRSATIAGLEPKLLALKRGIPHTRDAVSLAPGPVSAANREFCEEYRQRYLRVCADPFQFGAKAAVFCPLYSERCSTADIHGRSPKRDSEKPHQDISGMCNQFGALVSAHCGNPFLLLQPSVRDGCDKFKRFCIQ